QIEKGSNHVGFSNPEADKILEEGRRTFDREARAKLYRRFHQIIYDEQPYTFLYMGKALVVRDKRFGNVNIYPLGLDIREWKVQANP
ncbi:MAG: peptide-binding protein, partial [Candidatus Binatia bacterium]